MLRILTDDVILTALRAYGDVKPIPWDASDPRRHEHRVVDAVKAAMASIDAATPPST
jgi:hypothetical protein